MKDLIDAIYYINMDKSVERNTWMKKVLQDDVFDTMKKHRITGVDGTRKDIVPFLETNLQNIHKKYNPKISKLDRLSVLGMCLKNNLIFKFT